MFTIHADGRLSGDVVMCRWGVTKDSTIGEKGLREI